MDTGLQDSSPLKSRERLLAAAKSLIAEAGYEQASTAQIVRRAATSESQLIRNFGGKAGLLETIFEESWKPLIAHMRLISTKSAPQALAEMVAMFIQTLDQDPELAKLFLFESRRVRGPLHQISLSGDYFEFIGLLHQIVRDGQQDGTLVAHMNPEVVVAALFGAAEGMVREPMMPRPQGGQANYSNDDIRQLFEAILNGLKPDGRS